MSLGVTCGQCTTLKLKVETVSVLHAKCPGPEIFSFREIIMNSSASECCGADIFTFGILLLVPQPLRITLDDHKTKGNIFATEKSLNSSTDYTFHSKVLNEIESTSSLQFKINAHVRHNDMMR